MKINADGLAIQAQLLGLGFATGHLVVFLSIMLAIQVVSMLAVDYTR